jgi:predicted permease
MLKNFFKIALRNLLRHKGYTLVNISGLTVGLVVCMFILLYVKDELEFDGFHEQDDRLYRILEDQHYADGNVFTTSATPGPLAGELVAKIPEIKMAARVSWNQTALFQVGDKSLREEGRYLDGEFFQMFSFPLLEGDPRTVLGEPNSLVISEALARKYFGSESALGKQIRVNTKTDYRVTGVMKEIPKNSSLRFEYAMPFEDLVAQNMWLKEWGNNAPRTFILLAEGTNSKDVETKIEGMIKAHDAKSTTTLFLQKFGEIYLHADFSNGKRGEGRIQYVWLFTLVAAFILIIACVNFMNLATAQSARRAKEVGVRKAIGAPKTALVAQFLGESVLITFLAAAIAIGMAELLLPTFNQITEKHIELQFAEPGLWLGLLSLVVVTGLIAGSYPAFFMSSFGTISVLKGTFRLGASTVSLRKGLVIFQFFISTLLILGTVVVYKQIRFIHTKNLGMERENVLTIGVDGNTAKNYEPFKQELLLSPMISSVSLGSQVPFQIGNSTSGVSWPGKAADEKILFQTLIIDYDFIKTIGASIKEGRDFSRDYPSDVGGFILNEEAVKRMRLENPIGQAIECQGVNGPIIGVVKDFHNTTLQLGIEPLIIRHHNGSIRGTIFIKVAAGSSSDAIAVIENVFKKYNPSYPLEYHFLDEFFEDMYKSEKVTGILANFFAVVAILISCLGLFGLASYNAEQRSKEIGIRKVLGASIGGIVMLLTRDFLSLVLIGNLIAVPAAYFALRSWLDDYAYRTEMNPDIFIAAVAVSVVIALLTVIYKAVQAATANPVEALKYE